MSIQDAQRGLRASHLAKSYGPTRALSDVSLTIPPGRVVALVGHNGAGKSTLLRSLSGAERPDTGSLTIDGEEMRFTRPADAADAGIACVYQELSLVEELTVAQNLFLGREIRRNGQLQKAEMNRIADELCARLAIDGRATDRVADLPVAQRQMIEVARGVNRHAKYLLLDEPTTALEHQQVDQLFEVIRRLTREQGIGVLLVDHKMDEVYAIADHIVGIANGRSVLDGPVDQVDRHAVINAVVGDEDAAHIVESGHSRRSSARSKRHTDAPVFTAEHVSGPRLVDVTLEVHPGEILGVYGLVGSGRTRFLRTVYGAEGVTGGRMTLDGRPYAPRSPRAAVRAGVALVSEERKFDGFIPAFSSRDNVVLPLLDRFQRFGVLQRRRMNLAADEVLARVALRGEPGAPITSLSGGNQQKALFAKAALQAPRLLLLDEPTKGVDIGAKEEIYEIISHLARESGAAVILVSTEEEELLTLADSLIVFRAGSNEGSVFPNDDVTQSHLRELAWADASPATQ